MAGRTYNYEIQSNVGGAAAFFTLLTSFAVTCGWTVVDSETNKEWLSDGDGTYSWQAGNDQYAEILSTGYGNQSLRWRLHLEYVDASYGRLYQRGCDLDDYTVDETDDDYPVKHKPFVTSFPSYYCQPLPYATMQKVHFIGDETMIFWWFEYSTLVGYGGALGTWELDDEWQDTDEGLAEFQSNCVSGTTTFAAMINPDSGSEIIGIPFMWWNGSGTSCGSTYPSKWYMFGYLISTTQCAYSVRLRSDAYHSFGYMEGIGYDASWMVGRNTYSNKPPMVQPALSLVDDGGSGRLTFVGHLPCYIVDFSGLVQGQVLTYGTDKYVVFPHNSVKKPYGFAMKVDI